MCSPSFTVVSLDSSVGFAPAPADWRPNRDPVPVRLRRLWRRLNTRLLGGDAIEVPFEPARRTDQQPTSWRVAQIGQRVVAPTWCEGKLARSCRGTFAVN